MIRVVAGRSNINSENKEGNTALIYAVVFVNQLISAVADVNIVNKKEVMPLMIVARKGHVECLNELITACANGDKRDKYGKNSIDRGKEENAQRMCGRAFLKLEQIK